VFDFPGIYREANDISNKTQKFYLFVIKIYLFLLIISAILFTYFANIWEIKLANALISLVILSLSFGFFFYDFQGIWYNARAVAESIKTSCWRYAIKAEPYNTDDNEANTLLVETMKHIVDMNHDFKKHISAEFSSEDQLPNTLTSVRALPFNERLEYYHKNRVNEQREWYKNKSIKNKNNSLIYSWLLLMLSVTISVLLFLNIDKNNQIEYPVEILLSLISIIFTWIQTKKYKELNKSYALASYEIGFIATQKQRVDSEEKLSNYVNNSENAFSREHTQWIARKDN